LAPQATKDPIVTKNDIDEIKLRFAMIFSFRADEWPSCSLSRSYYERDRSTGSPTSSRTAFRPGSALRR
jgi:hypothetical protein